MWSIETRQRGGNWTVQQSNLANHRLAIKARLTWRRKGFDEVRIKDPNGNVVG